MNNIPIAEQIENDVLNLEDQLNVLDYELSNGYITQAEFDVQAQELRRNIAFLNENFLFSKKECNTDVAIKLIGEIMK